MRAPSTITSGGLIKVSVAWRPEELEELDRLARERGPSTTRSDVIRDCFRLARRLYEQQTRLLQAMHPGADEP